MFESHGYPHLLETALGNFCFMGGNDGTEGKGICSHDEEADLVQSLGGGLYGKRKNQLL